MQRDLAAAAGTLVGLLALDALWLGVLAKGFYQEHMGPLMLEQPRFGVAALFYVLYTVGLVVFAVRPALEVHSLARAALLGGMLGFLAYMTYDLTNLATLRGWSVPLVVVDLAWGTFMSACAAMAGCVAAGWVRG